jgi:hypothetical protein
MVFVFVPLVCFFLHSPPIVSSLSCAPAPYLSLGRAVPRTIDPVQQERRQSARLSDLRSQDVESRRLAMAARGLSGSDWLASVACRWCRSTKDETNMLLCDGCGAGSHFYCGPLATEVLPPDDESLWTCVFCTRGENIAIWDIESRPPPLSSAEVQARIGVAVVASYAASTLEYDDRVFADFEGFVEGNYGYVLGNQVDFFNSERCRRHRAESVAGYLSGVRFSLSAPLRDPYAVLCALRRAFRLHALCLDSFGAESLSHRVAQGLRMLSPPVCQPKKVGVTREMLLFARADASLVITDRVSLQRRMLGLAAVYSYCAGARISELASTSSVYTRRHTALWGMVHANYSGNTLMSVEVFTKSSKTTGPGRGARARPVVLEFHCGDALTEESELSAFLGGGLVRWRSDSGGLAEDPVFCFRHGAYRKCLSRGDFIAYTKQLAELCHLPAASFSSKSWKVGRVSRGVLAGEASVELLRRGNHLTVSANRHYRPIVRALGRTPAPGLGVPDDFARSEIRRDHIQRGNSPSGLDVASSSSDSE